MQKGVGRKANPFLHLLCYDRLFVAQDLRQVRPVPPGRWNGSLPLEFRAFRAQVLFHDDDLSWNT